MAPARPQPPDAESLPPPVLLRWIDAMDRLRHRHRPGGLRTQAEKEKDPALLQEHPDSYQSAEEARAHGAKLAGGSFGALNVQAWANATCTTIRSATNLVNLHHEEKDLKKAITID